VTGNAREHEKISIMMPVITVLECQKGRLSQLSSEALGAAQELASLLGTVVDAIVMGSGSEGAVSEVASYDIRQVLHLTGAQLETYTPDVFTLALSNALNNLDASFVVLPHSYQVREFAPKLTARMDLPFLSDCTGFRLDGEDVVFSRQVYQGKLYADVSFAGAQPYFVSVQAGSFRSGRRRPDGSLAPKTKIEMPEYIGKIRTRPLERVQETERILDLSQSNVIVAVGRGLKEAENLPMVEELARALNGQVAGSRPVCDNGWLAMDRQVGSSGQTVAPNLYLAIGISGAIQHVVGMKGSRKIVAINKDPNAPIFDIADIGIVANLFDVVPSITKEIIKIKQERNDSASLQSDSSS